MVLLWQPLQELVPPERGGTDAPETASHQGSFQQGPGHALALAPPKAQPLQVFKVGWGFEEPGLVEHVPAHGREVEVDGL